METLFFISGLLTIASIIMLVGVVVFMLKISKLTKQVNDMHLLLEREVDALYASIQSEHRSTWLQFEACGRDVTMVERTIMQRIDKEVGDMHRDTETVVQELHRDIDETKRYVDSRIDKTVLSGSMKSSKQTING